MPVPLKLRSAHRHDRLSRSLLYEDVHVWLVVAAFLDVVIAWSLPLVGGHYGVPLLSARVLALLGGPGLLLYKVFLIVLMVVISEEIGRRRPVTGRRVADLFAIVMWLPVVMGLIQLLPRLL